MLRTINILFISSFISFVFIACSEDKTKNTNEVLITKDGVVYDIVVSPYTAKVWLDRNLGASQVCNSFDDKDCFGDYYQWGRDSDGHENNTSEVNTTLAADIDNAGESFIVSTTSPYDWVSLDANDTNGSKRAKNWSKTDGSSVCPVGFRVPTIDELKAETIDSVDGMTNIEDAFNNFLKLPLVGYRVNTNGGFNPVNSQGSIWSSSRYNDDKSSYLYFYNAGADESYSERTMGFSIRCVKDVAIISDAGEDQQAYEGDSVTLDANGSSSDSDIITYIWKENGVVLSEASSFSKSDFSVGTHNITLTITDKSGNMAIDKLVVIINEPRAIVTHNGFSYYTVVSPYTAKVWLDRNLGASQACEAKDDTLCFGDYYQWGRGADGHENNESNITRTLAIDIENAGIDFIAPTQRPFEWISADVNDTNGSKRSKYWSKIDGSSVCPTGYRVSTRDELKAETIDSTDGMTNNDEAFSNFLKLPSVGYRRVYGSILKKGYEGGLWTSDVAETDSEKGSYLYFGSRTHITKRERAHGYPVRCIKD